MANSKLSVQVAVFAGAMFAFALFPPAAIAAKDECTVEGIIKWTYNGAKSTGILNLERRAHYVNLTGQLDQKIDVAGVACGLNASNILFLLRQSVVDVDYATAGPENSDQMISGDLSSMMFQAFSKGKYGLPKDAQLASCWWNAQGSLTRCEAMEMQKYCKIREGTQPKGFKRMRPRLARPARCLGLSSGK